MSSPSSEPNKPNKQPAGTSNRGSVVVVVEGPGDRTRRPRRPNIPRPWPKGESPGKKKPTEDKKPSEEQKPPEEPPQPEKS